MKELVIENHPSDEINLQLVMDFACEEDENLFPIFIKNGTLFILY